MIRTVLLLATVGVLTVAARADAANDVLGTWRLVSAQLDPEGENLPAYGEAPNGMLVFTADMHFVVVLTDGDLPRFASDVRGEGTDVENREAMARGIGFFGTYSVDETGAFSGNVVEGSTFPNWIGSVRTRRELTMTVEGDEMTENFRRPDGTRIAVLWRRQR